MPLFLIIGSHGETNEAVKKLIEDEGSTAHIAQESRVFSDFLEGYEYDQFIFNSTVIPGLKVAEAMMMLRKKFPHTPIIYHTGYSQNALKRVLGYSIEELEKMSVTYVSKGSPNELIETIKRLWRQS